MKTFILVFLLFIPTMFYGQINLEHTFTSDKGAGSGVSFFITQTKGIMYYSIGDTITNQIRFYNQDYSLYKSVTINRPKGFTINVTLPSEQLFHSNNSIEFICYFLKGVTSGYVSKLIIYDENGTIIKDFGLYNSYMFPILISNGYFSKLNLRSVLMNANKQFVDEVYSLPGNMPSNLPELKISRVKSAYPNPSKSTINLPYALGSNEVSNMRIFKENGQLVDQKIIDSMFDRIILNVESYEKGIYYYEYNGITNKFIVN